MFTVGVALRLPRSSPSPEYEFWQTIEKKVEALSRKTNGRITLDTMSSELTLKRVMKDSMLWCGAAQFDFGKIVHILELPEDRESFFDTYTEDSPP